MTATIATPNDRASFNAAMTTILAEHATLRRLAAVVAERPAYSADAAMSLADAVSAHESAEARLFDLPFLTRTPESVISTAERVRRRRAEYTSGDIRLPDPGMAAALFAEALLAHLAAEEAWLDQEAEHQRQRLRIIV